MNINGKPYRTIWLARDGRSVEIIDQTRLPHALEIATLRTLEDAARAIKTMQVRGAPLIGTTAAYGVCLALNRDTSDEALDAAIERLAAQRPTAVNLRWALEEMAHAVRNLPRQARLRQLMPAPPRSAKPMWSPTRPSAGMALRSSSRPPRARRPASPSTSSPTATPAGSPASTAEQPPPRSTGRTTAGSRCTSGSTRPARATRAPHSPPGSSAATACPTPSSSTTPAAT